MKDNEVETQSQIPTAQDMLGTEGAARLLQQAFEIWVNPEIERRRASGAITEPFILNMAQMLQWPDGPIEVRLNDEVRGIALVEPPPRAVEKGGEIFLSDFDGLRSFDLIEEELDAGHWTIVWTGSKWVMGFNFLSNRGRCGDLLEKAGQFVQAAEYARGLNHGAVAVDNLFSACELIAKAELVLSHQLSMASKTHGAIAAQINRWRKAGNVEGAFVDLFNTLGRLRPRYRYDASVSDPMPVTAEDFELVRAMIDKGRERVRHKTVSEKKIPPSTQK